VAGKGKMAWMGELRASLGSYRVRKMQKPQQKSLTEGAVSAEQLFLGP
jgi:hypothetical protein